MTRVIVWVLGFSLLLTGCVKPLELPEYQIRRGMTTAPDLGNWHDPAWSQAETIELQEVYVSTLFCPRVQMRMLYQEEGIFAIFRIEDRFVQARALPQSDRISFDSCVELFLQRPDDPEYLCFELAASGNALFYDCLDINRGKYRKFPEEDYRRITVVSTFPGLRQQAEDLPEIWSVGVFIPFDLIAEYTEASLDVDDLSGEVWRGNFYKCAVWANPHWLSWSRMPRVDFHLPAYFGQLCFE